MQCPDNVSIAVHTTPHLDSVTILAWRQKLSTQPWGGHLTHNHQLRHLLHTPEVRLGNTFWTKQMWAVVFYD